MFMRKFISGILLTSILFSAMAIIPGQAFASTTTTVSISGSPYGSSPTYVNFDSQFTLSATSSGASVESTWYRWNDYDITEYVEPFFAVVEFPTPGAPAMPEDLEGLNTLYYYSVDSLGSTESIKSLDVYIDVYAPATEIHFAGDNYSHAGTTFINTTTSISLSSSDTGSGLKNIFYKVDSNQLETYSSPFTIPVGSDHTITYYAEDNLGIQENEQTINIYLDTASPTIAISMGQPNSSDVYVTSSTIIEINADDGGGSGIEVIKYKIDQSSWITYSSSVILSIEGSQTITAYALDMIGNPSTEITKSIVLDDSPPAASAPDATDGNLELKKGDPIYLESTDSGVGDSTIFYSLDGGITWQEYIILVADEDVIITYYAEDVLGNTGAEKTLTVTVASSPDVVLYFGIALVVVGVLIGLYLFITREKPVTKKKASGKEPETKKKKSKRRN